MWSPCLTLITLWNCKGMTGGYLSSYPPTRWIPFVWSFPNTTKVLSEIMRKSIICVCVCVCVCVYVCVCERERLIKLIIKYFLIFFQFKCSVQFSCSVVSNSLQPHESQHARPPCPSPTPRVHPNPCALSWWCHPTISSSVVPFSCPQSFPASGSFQMSQLFASGGRSIGVSASAQSFQWTPRTDLL